MSDGGCTGEHDCRLVCQKCGDEWDPPSPRRLYLVHCPDAAGGHLIVRSDSAEGAASFLRIRLLDDELVSSDVEHEYLVSEENDELGDGLWLSGYDRSDDEEGLLRMFPRGYGKGDEVRLWKDAVTVRM